MVVQHVIVGGKNGNPALLKTSIDPVTFRGNVGIAIKSIYHGALSSTNLVLKLKHNGETLTFPTVATARSRLDIFRELMKDVANVVLELKLSNSVFLTFERVGKTTRYNIKCGDGIELVEIPKVLETTYDKEVGMWYFNSKTLVKNTIVDRVDITIGFIYLNVVDWNFLNGMKSRLIAVAPLQHGTQYCHFEFKNPSYAKLDVSQFAYLEVSIRNLKGELIPFSSNFDTVVTLDIAQL